MKKIPKSEFRYTYSTGTRNSCRFSDELDNFSSDPKILVFRGASRVYEHRIRMGYAEVRVVHPVMSGWRLE